MASVFLFHFIHKLIELDPSRILQLHIHRNENEAAMHRYETQLLQTSTTQTQSRNLYSRMRGS
jgi:hypothetical protein